MTDYEMVMVVLTSNLVLIGIVKIVLAIIKETNRKK
ncbi:hypothetical protein J2Z58_003103 [Halobacillus andaensis]|nr:hypothetical protein [Halobacillus andaensis]